MREFIAILAGILALLAAVPYIIDIVKGKTKPNIVSWFTWTFLLALGTFAAFAAHETRSALLTLGDTIGTALILLLGIKYGIAKFTWFDAICQIGAITGLVLWLIFNSPTVAIISVITVDLLASIPTVRHSWVSPSEETWQHFTILFCAAALTLLILTNYTIASASLPLYFLCANGTISFVVLYRRQQLNSQTLLAGLNKDLDK